MPSDDRVDPPEQPKTTQIAAVPQWAVELTQAMKSGIAEVRADVALVSNDLGLLKTRVSIMEGLRTEDDMRASKYSGGIKSLSTSNAEQDAQLAQERMAREALAAKVDKLDEVLQAQSDFMGIGKRGAEWLASKEGRTAMAQLGAAIVVLYEALKHGGVLK